MGVPFSRYATATAGTATIALSGAGANQIEGGQITWSYNGTPSGGASTLTVTDTTNSVVIFSIDITTAGAGFIPLTGLYAGSGDNLSVTLGSGGSGVVGKLNVSGSYL